MTGAAGSPHVAAPAEAAVAVPGAPAPSRRLIGLDIARALAFGGMLMAHFAFTYSRDDPGWLQALDNASDGRAAPLFCMLLGVGAGILTARGASDAVFVKRGLALFAIGLAIWPFVDTVYLILPHYGLLLALVPLWRRIPTRWLPVVAVAAFLTPSIITALVDGHGMRGAPQPDSYGELTDLWWLLSNLVWTGGYPMVGWLGFALMGLWLMRLRLDEPNTQRWLLVGSVAVMLFQPTFAAIFQALGGPPEPDTAGGVAAFFDGAAHSNQAAWYILATATAIAVIAGCLIVTRRPSSWSRPLVHLGQLMLSAYVAQLLVGEAGVWDWLDREQPSLAFQMALALAIFAVMAVLASLWRAKFRRGPLEGLVRAVSG